MDIWLRNEVLTLSFLFKLLKACLLGAVSIYALFIPPMAIPLLFIGYPIIYLPWVREFFGYGSDLRFYETWTGIAVFFVYFSVFWGWVEWYRERRRAARLDARLAAGQDRWTKDEDLFTLLIVAMLPILLMAVLLVPIGWAVMLVAIGFAFNASYRGVRAFNLPWSGIFFLLGALYIAAVVFVIVGLTHSFFR